jgi:outer membrane protein OmpA-like peptidoglycan-associated protein
MGVALRAGLILLVAGLLGACASGPPKSREFVVLVPDYDGKVGAVVITSAQGKSTLDKPYMAARYEDGGKVETAPVAQEEVRKTFAMAIAVQPVRPVSFLLYFQEGTDEYTAESKVAFEKIFPEIARRKAAEVAVIGHTDTVGRIESNDALSLRRAERVRNDFVDRGIPTIAINVAGRGEREPIVPTADEVSEPRNRRVEINVR